MSKASRDNIVQSVLLPLPFGRGFDYLIEADTPLPLGSYVQVPFGKKQLIGVVWSNETEDKVAFEKLKKVSEVFDFEPMSDAHRKFLNWLSDYTMAPLGSVLKMSIPVRDALEKPKKVLSYYLNKSFNCDGVRITPKRQEVLDYFNNHENKPVPASFFSKELGVSTSILKGMMEQDILKMAYIEPVFSKDFTSEVERKHLSEKQQEAVTFCKELQEKDFSVTLLDGVTGSGKTEVYFNLIEEQISKGNQSLVLLPEIALTQQIIERFRKRFGEIPTIWHSNLTPAQRRDNWRLIASGKAQVIIGARSALLLPYKKLDLIVIDEEHDNAYKQEEGVLYNARDMAVVRCKMMHSHLILASATPSLETLLNVEHEKYAHFVLPSRYGESVLPDMHLIDLRRDKPEKDHWISPTLAEALKKTYERGEQSLIFLNRRGYAPLTICRDCGHRFDCPNCSTSLVEHKRFHRLQCHHCGYVMPKPDSCEGCGSVDSFIPCGPGVERMIEEVREILPTAKQVVFSSDNMKDPDILKNSLHQIQKGKFDVLIGTQMLAKGHHFPHLTTVGIIDADSGLAGGDLRGSERSYQLLHQVSGRAGRESKKGHVYIQTRQEDHPIIQALKAQDRDAFVELEMSARDEADMPPFTRLVALIISGEDEQQIIRYTKELAFCAPSTEQFMVFGPAQAPLARIRGQYRYRFLVKADKFLNVQKTLKEWLNHIKKPNALKVQIDVDPMSFL